MKFWDLLIKNWAQISFVLIAIGYIVKVILEITFKKKEIRFNFFLTNRMKSIEKFLSDYSNLESTFRDTSTSYINKMISSKQIDDIIVPLRYKLTESLSSLQLYTSDKEFGKFSNVYSNFIFLMGEVSTIKYEPKLQDIERSNKLLATIDKTETYNKMLLKEIVKQIQKDIL